MTLMDRWYQIIGLCWLSVAITACDSGASIGSSTEVDGNGASMADPWVVDQAAVDEVAFRPVSHQLAVRGSIEVKAAPLGGNGGSEFALDCGAGQVLAGLAGRAGSLIDQISALCVDVDASGLWTSTPQPAGAARGGSGGTAFERMCPTNSALIGIEGAVDRSVVGSLVVHCRPLSARDGTSGEITALAASGGNYANPHTFACAERGVATGIHGRSGSLVDQLGLTCREDPYHAGRWSNPVDWPIIAVHSVLTPEGKVLSYGTDLVGRQGAHFQYDVWDPEAGFSDAAHNTLDNSLAVDSFCGAAVIMPESGNILMPGGDGRFGPSVNTGIVDAVIFDTASETLSAAADMPTSRWYPTATTLPSGEILMTGGIDSARNQAVTPEVYTPATNQWRSLFGINTAANNFMYPRQWVAEDGRIFGISARNMYFLDVAGAGALETAGTLPDVTRGSGSTAAMYQPGKILQVGGGGSGGGRGAVVVDIETGTPDARSVASMTQYRNAWSNSVLLADGSVIVMGGSRVGNNAETATVSPELWNPQTETWTQMSNSQFARLYHSTAVLLKDARVLLAGGGAPGPFTNLNAEIYTPPYLFDANGNLRARPRIDWAPPNATYNEQIALTHAGDLSVSRVTMVKTSAVTHSFNNEQRFRDLSFSQADGVVNVLMPESANAAPPGYYMLFVFNQDGTPSAGQILNMGFVPAPQPPVDPEPVEPDPSEVAENLLVNGGFETGDSDWLECANADLTSLSFAARHGNQAMTVDAGGCLYQEFPVTVGISYDVACEARNGESVYSSVSMQMLTADYAELAIAEAVVASREYSTVSTLLEAGSGSVRGVVNLYSEGPADFDSCRVLARGEPVPVDPVEPVPDVENRLANGGFEAGKSAWTDCAAQTRTQPSDDTYEGAGALTVSSAGCIYQEFAVTPGRDYQLRCHAKSEGSQYSSLSIQMANADYIALDAASLPIGQNRYQLYEAMLTAPEQSVTSAVTLYSEDMATFDGCSVREL